MENPDLVLQDKGSSPTRSSFNHVPSGDTLRHDAMSSYTMDSDLCLRCMFNVLVVAMDKNGSTTYQGILGDAGPMCGISLLLVVELKLY